MPRRVVQMIVSVSAPVGMKIPAALTEVRLALQNSEPGELSYFTVSPIPRDRVVKRRKSPTRQEVPPLLAYMERVE